MLLSDFYKLKKIDMELIKCSDYVIGNMNVAYQTHTDILDRIRTYANFLKQPLTLGMFIPCDLDGNVLEEPKSWDNYLEFSSRKMLPNLKQDIREYKQAKERVLFEGFEIDYFNNTIGFMVGKEYLRYWKSNRDFEFSSNIIETIEDLTDLKLTLTPNAEKLIK